MFTYSALIFSMIFALGLAGCMTPREKTEMHNDISDLQGRLTQLERHSKEKGANFDSRDEKNKKQIAATQTETERLTLEIQKLRGELDALKVGVKTGEMPGTGEEDQSVAKSIAALNDRMDAIEARQEAQVKAKAPNAKKDAKEKDKDAGKKGAKVDTLKDLKEAFEKGKFAIVADVGPDIAKDAKAGDKEEAQFYVAESLYRLGKMRDAALKYNDFVEQYTSSSRMAVAKMRLGDCFRRLGDKNTAKLYYQELVTKFPQSDQAKKAQERLDTLDKEGASNRKPGSKVRKVATKETDKDKAKKAAAPAAKSGRG